MSENQENQVPDSAFQIAHPDAKPATSDVVIQNVQLVKYHNYPPLIKHMHFDPKSLTPNLKHKILLLFTMHILMIVGPFINIILCILEVAFGGIGQPVLKLILSIIFFFVWTITGYYHFFHGSNLLVQLRGRAWAYYFTALIIAIRFALWSIFAWGDANGFIAMVRLFSHGNIAGGIFSIIYIALTLPVAFLAVLGAIFVYRR